MNNPDLAALAARGNAAAPRRTRETSCDLPVLPGESPVLLSGLGLAVAQDKGDLQEAIALCKEALRRAPEDPVHYLHLGKVYLLAGKKHLALYTFRKGLKYGHHRDLANEIGRLGFRRCPPFPFLGRKHPLNRLAGRLLARLGFR